MMKLLMKESHMPVGLINSLMGVIMDLLLRSNKGLGIRITTTTTIEVRVKLM